MPPFCPPSFRSEFRAESAPLVRRWCRLALLAVLLLASAARAADCPVPAPAGTGQTILSGDVVPAQSLLRDTGGRLTLAEVASPAYAAAFVPLAGQLVAAPTSDVLWVRFCLPPQADDAAGERPRWLRIGPPIIDRLTLYRPGRGSYEASETGDHLPFAGREWPYHQFAFAIPPDTDVQRPFFLRIATASELNLRLDLWEEHAFRTLIGTDYALYGMYCGAMLLLITFSLVFWVWLRDPLYLVYALNVIAGGILHLLNAGFASQYLYPESPALNDRMLSLLTGPLVAVHVLFFSYLFAVRRNAPWAFPALILLAAVYFASSPLSFFVDWAHLRRLLRLLALPIGFLGVPLILFLGWKDRERRLYVLAFVPWVVIAAAQSINRLGWIPGGPLLDYSQEAGSFIHLVLLPILLARRALRSEKEKELAQELVLESLYRVERELEARVDYRTTELADANAKLEREMRERLALQTQLEEALQTERQTLATQRQFVSMLSHEFRTPLAIIDTAAQRMGPALEQRQPDLLPKVGKIRRAVARQLNLLENCLAEDRLAASELALYLESVDLRDFLVRTYGGKALQGAQRLRLRLPETAEWVECDRHLIDVVLSNLVSNALKYSPEESPVTIRLLPDARPGQVLIRVEDEGRGVPPEEREHIFGKFLRGEGNQRISGAGLGLHLARELARRHGGDVVLEPDGTAPGAAFTLILPRPAWFREPQAADARLAKA
ncbi:MAG: hypothetical protein BGO63_15470 [Candidatus Accumulibacter sp. 66-26]|nr:sensor histidine kinase [Accumulibacter sp.]OJW46926.1 MAG: hypothetical protein BGO63_15470 [Candidatus Accumulibacter sp. 66-26]